MHTRTKYIQIPSLFEVLTDNTISLGDLFILSITIFLVVMVWRVNSMYLKGYSNVIKKIGPLYDRFYGVWPSFLFVHTSWVIAFGAFLVGLVFLPFTDRLIVNVTAAYATVLFLQGSLRTKVPLLNIEFQDNPPWSTEDNTELIDRPESEFVVKQKITVENFGDAPADNLYVKCRVVCPGKGITREWEQVTFGDDDRPSVQSDEDVETELVLDTFDEYKGQEYLVEIKAKPNVRQGHLTLRRFHLTVPRKPDSS